MSRASSSTRSSKELRQLTARHEGDTEAARERVIDGTRNVVSPFSFLFPFFLRVQLPDVGGSLLGARFRFRVVDAVQEADERPAQRSQSDSESPIHALVVADHQPSQRLRRLPGPAGSHRHLHARQDPDAQDLADSNLPRTLVAEDPRVDRHGLGQATGRQDATTNWRDGGMATAVDSLASACVCVCIAAAFAPLLVPSVRSGAGRAGDRDGPEGDHPPAQELQDELGQSTSAAAAPETRA